MFDDVNIKIDYMSSKVEQNYTITQLKITDLASNKEKIVLHFHYKTWPDFGVPSTPTQFIEFLSVVRSYGVLQCRISAEKSLSGSQSGLAVDEDDVYDSVENPGPAIIHCSAGIGRSGTFCLVDSCLAQIEIKKDLDISVCGTLHIMRRYRDNQVQTAKQLRFSYQAIIEGAQRILRPKSTNNNFPSYNITTLKNKIKYENTNNSNSIVDSSIDTDSKNNGDNERHIEKGTRNRKLNERNTRLKEQLSAMVNKQHKHETDVARRPYYTIAAGGAIAITLACYAYNYYRK